jgi:hypothetical protein
MRKLFFLLLLGLGLFVYFYRFRVFLRDPLAEVTRDGAPVDHAVAMIDYANDVLLLDRSTGHLRIYLLEHWNQVTGTPPGPLNCLGDLACMTDADQAAMTPVTPGARGNRSPFEGVTMTDRRVEFVDEEGALIQVLLH